MESHITPETPVDFERLREISDGDADLIEELVSLFIEQTREFLEDLKTAISNQDFDAVQKIAHKAVGSSATCGMNAIIPFLRELERSGESKNLATADQTLEQAQSAFAQICQYLEDQKDQN